MSLRPRHFSKRLKSLLKLFPIVCILGPRQCGKTTFAKTELKGWHYADIEKPSDFTRLSEDPEHFLNHYQSRIIIDEAQRFPELFGLLRSYVDGKAPQKGMIVLLGSASFELVKGISESLAGRVGFLDMTPFQLDEVDQQDKLWLQGGFPQAYLQKKSGSWQDWFESYARTFIERDLPGLGIQVSAVQMRKLWAMLSHVHGCLWNASELANSLGVTYHTVNRYADILEQTYLIRRLMPFHTNIKKRLVKNAKLYIRDSGLLHYLLGIEDKTHLETHPKRGASWEGFAIEQIINTAVLKNPGTEFYFWRTSTGQEVDLLLKRGSSILPIEIKTHTAPDKSLVKGLFHCLADLKLNKGWVVVPKGNSYSLGQGIQVVSLKGFLDQMAL